MKVIELLNKIANGEEVPEKIKVHQELFEFNDDTYYNCHDDTLGEYFDLGKCLNYEIEIIEEPKKIEKIKQYYYVSNDIENIDKALFNNLCSIIENQRTQEDKLNEIIDYINKENR